MKQTMNYNRIKQTNKQKMEYQRTNDRIKDYIQKFKDDIYNHTCALQSNNPNSSFPSDKLMEYINQYEILQFEPEELRKRKRIKNVIPSYDRCSANRANKEQCTRKRKENFIYCGTHLKGTPHGILDSCSQQQDSTVSTKTVEVILVDIKGILYYIDQDENVYHTEDIIRNVVNPAIIAKYKRNEDGSYFIPEYQL